MRFLLVAPIYTASRFTGGGQRTILLYRALREIGDVDLLLVSEPVCSNFEQDLAGFHKEFSDADSISIIRSTPQFMFGPPSSRTLLNNLRYQLSKFVHAVRHRSHFYNPSKEAKSELDSLLNRKDYDAIVGRYLNASALSGALLQTKVPVVVDLDDLDEVVIASRMRSATTSRLKRLALGFQLWQIKPLVRALRRSCHHLFISTEEDRQLIGNLPYSVLQNIPFPTKDLQVNEENVSSRVILFVGTFGHRVNRDGVVHFINNCWPEIIKQLPDTRLRIVGSGGWESLRSRFEVIIGVDIVGRVENIADEYGKAALCISPVFEGAGTKIKILESLLYQRAIVAAGFSLRGFDRSELPGLIRVDSDSEMIEQCLFLLRNPEIRRDKSVSSRGIVASQYSAKSISETVSKALLSLDKVKR